MNQLKKLILKYLPKKRHVKRKNGVGKRKKLVKKLAKKPLYSKKIKQKVKKNNLVVNNQGKNKSNK